MEDDIMAGEWKKELRILLDQIQASPSTDWTAQRERIAVLNTLIASRTPIAA